MVVQPCRPPPSLDHPAERAVVAGGQRSRGRFTQRLLVSLALLVGQVCAGVVDPLADLQGAVADLLEADLDSVS